MRFRLQKLAYPVLVATTIGIGLHASGSLPSRRVDPDVDAASVGGVVPAVRNAHLAAVPLYFEANRGQTDLGVKYLARTGGGTLYLTAAEAVLTRTTAEPLRLRLAGANPRPEITGLDALPGKANYLIGSDPRKWQTGVSTFARVKYRDVYPGIDLVYYGNPRELEYDFIVAPGADPARIALDFAGAERLELDADGNLLLHTPDGVVVQRAPCIYQEIQGARRSVPGRYLLREGPDGKQRSPRVAFAVGDYDRRRPLVIDPVLVYSTYFGGNGSDLAFDMAVDGAGGIYLTGQTMSTTFPIAGALQPIPGGGSQDGFVAKLSGGGTRIEWATYLGGYDFDRPRSVAVDDAGNVYVVGHTRSPDFPMVNARQPRPGGDAEGFITKLDGSGSRLIYSTFHGGNSLDECLSVALIDGDVCVTGQTYSNNLPLANAHQPIYRGNGDAFVARLDASGAVLRYSSYLGGTGFEWGSEIATDAQGNAYLTGRTTSRNFPTLNALRAVKGDTSNTLNDAFITKVNATGALDYSTYLGGSGDDLGWSIAADAVGNAYVTGRTTSSQNFPLVGAFQSVYRGGGGDAFVAKLDAAGKSLVYSSYLGGSGDDNPVGADLVVDAAGRAYVVGYTTSSNFPVLNAIQPSYGGTGDGFLAVFNTAGSALVSSTYLGGTRGDEIAGIALDASGNLYVAGGTTSTGLATANALQPGIGGLSDMFVAKIVDATLDIQPGELPNSVDLRSQGILPVALLSNLGFDARTVDMTTVTLGDPRLAKATAPLRSELQDLNGDGMEDLLFSLRIPDLVDSGTLDASTARLVLRGRTRVGGIIVAEDSLRIAP